MIDLAEHFFLDDDAMHEGIAEHFVPDDDGKGLSSACTLVSFGPVLEAWASSCTFALQTRSSFSPWPYFSFIAAIMLFIVGYILK